MTQYDNTNRGVLFKNDKQGNEKRPDYTGSINVDGAEFQLSAWIKEAKSGSKFMSISVQPKRDAAPKQETPKSDFEDSDIPF